MTHARNNRWRKRAPGLLLTGVVLGLLGWRLADRLLAPSEAGESDERRPVPVEVAAITRGTIEERRTFNGTLAPRMQIAVAPKIAGRIASMAVDLGDLVRRGQVIAVLDDAEFVQEVAQAEAERAVAEANRAEARSALEVAARDRERNLSLRDQGVASESQLDAIEATFRAREAQLQVAEAGVKRAEAALEAARIQLDYTTVRADWPGDDHVRFVGERLVDPGNTVSANTPLVSVVDLDPVTAVVQVVERDYARLQVGQRAELATDAFAGEHFPAEIVRLAPVFREASRQARVELAVANQELRLKPGMFARVTIVLGRAGDATIVPLDALVERDGVTGVFLVNDAGDRVTWREVQPGIRTREHVQLLDAALAGRVVTLGQQLLEDGAAIVIPAERTVAAPRAPALEREDS